VGQPSLFDEPFDVPTDPRVIDPGGTPIPGRVKASWDARRAALAAADREEQNERGPAQAAELSPPVVATDFRPGTTIRVPSGAKSRARANLEAIGLVRQLDAEERAATPGEQDTLAAWSGWGAVPQIFDGREDWAAEHTALRGLLSPQEYRRAESNTLNAHYTDPEIAAALWEGLRTAGFTGGRVLEPGCGSGTFLGLAPPEASMVGVELDPVTAKISAYLYPSAQVRNEGFETTRVPENSFTATIGNVPFGSYAVHDPAHNPARHSIHNHFILKSLALTAPGGYVATISSHFTMDATSERARRDIAATADLVGAVRLPTKAFDRVAGTDAVTDILLLRKREEGRAPAEGQDWIRTRPVAATDKDGAYTETDINAYFAAHPENVLGALHVGHGMYNAETLEVRRAGDAPLAEAVGERLGAITVEAARAGLGLSATAQSTTEQVAVFDPGLLRPVEGQASTALATLRYDQDSNTLQRFDGGDWVAHPAQAGKVTETAQLLHLRDLAGGLIRAQLDGLDAADRDQLRGELNRTYDAYVARHGPINRFTWTKPADITAAKHDERFGKAETKWRKQNAEDGVPYSGSVPAEVEEKWDEKAWAPTTPSKRSPHLDGGIRNDPTFATVAALEVFDEDTQTARKAPLFSIDVVGPRPARTQADTVEAALAISLDETHTVDVERIAALLGTDTAAAREALTGRVYPDPDEPDVLIPAAEYCSGNVRTKLAAAQAAAEEDPAFGPNVAALSEVMPRTIEAAEIAQRPGVPWVPVSDYRAFVTEVLGARDVEVDHTLGHWSIEVPKYQRGTPLMTDTYGTGHKDAVELLESLCNATNIQVNRSKEEVERTGGGALDTDATFAAQAQARKLGEKWTEWLWSDPRRSERLVGVYNARFNSLRARTYDGSQMELAGLGEHFTPHPYQRNAAARMVAEPTVLLDHVVGAGKTGSMLMGAMEQKRLGLVSQPWMVVPNHIIDQVGREAKQWYPGANVLVGTTGADATDRRRLVAQTATSEWDLVIIPESVFTAIKVSPQRQAAHLDAVVDAMRDARGDARGSGNETSFKRLQQAIEKMEERIERLTDQDRKDTGLTFEESGCDYLIVDEAHMFKNKMRPSGVAELACSPGSQKAEGLAMKLEVLRERRRDRDLAEGRVPGPERVATFATGTPVANSLGEMWVMQSYLRPDLLEDAGVAGIDAWGAVFTGTTSSVEMNATGSKLRPVTRIGEFVNVPELVAAASVYTDAVTRDEVAQVGRIPELETGTRQVISKHASQEVRDFITDLAWRGSNFDPKRPDIDNSLKLSNDGRNVSMDERMANLGEPLDGGRVDLVATQVARVWEQNRDTVYHDDAGRAEQLPGGMQIVFCDRSTPHQKNGGWSLYEGLRDELVMRGMDPATIRFIHDYPKPTDKAQLFRDCRAGKVAVLMGSTEKMGTGTNIQDRAVALHHMDVPWRPADLEQREGRILRQGNKNPSVGIFNYVTEGTFDTIMWQTVERKARFIAQLKTGNTEARTAADVGGDDLGNAAAATKAIATGDPCYVEQVQLEDEVKRLSAMQRAHSDAKARNATDRRGWGREVTATQEQMTELDRMLPALTANEQAPFAMTVGEAWFTERAEAAPALLHSLREAYVAGRRFGQTKEFPIAELRGVQVRASRMLSTDEMMVSLSVPGRTRSLQAKDFTGNDTAPLGLVRRVENMVADTATYRDELARRHDNALTRIGELEAVADEPFEHTDALRDKRQRLDTLAAQLRTASDTPEAQAARAEHEQRLEEAGRKPGWSLLLNPTPALLTDMGVDPVEYKARIARGAGNGPVRRGERDRSAAARTLMPSQSALRAARSGHTSTVTAPGPNDPPPHVAPTQHGHGPRR